MLLISNVLPKEPFDLILIASGLCTFSFFQRHKFTFFVLLTKWSQTNVFLITQPPHGRKLNLDRVITLAKFFPIFNLTVSIIGKYNVILNLL